MSTVTKPIMKDETGQDLVAEAQNIVLKLQDLINAVKPTAADIPLAAISGMTADDVQEGVAELKSNLVNTTIGKGSYSNTIYGAYGFISGGGKTIYLTVPISLAPDITSVAFTSFKIGLRLSTGGYAGGADNTEVATLITDTWLYPKNGNMMVKIVSSTAFSADNNICCVGTGNMTGTFS